MLQSFYPTIEASHKEAIEDWIRDYKIIKSNFVKQRDFKENIKHPIPNSGLNKQKTVFRSFDREEKGWLNIDDFREGLKSFFTAGDAERVFNEHCEFDKEKQDKVLYFLSFLQMILPPGSNFDVNVNRINQFDPRFSGYSMDLSIYKGSYLLKNQKEAIAKVDREEREEAIRKGTFFEVKVK